MGMDGSDVVITNNRLALKLREWRAPFSEFCDSETKSLKYFGHTGELQNNIIKWTNGSTWEKEVLQQEQQYNDDPMARAHQEADIAAMEARLQAARDEGGDTESGDSP